MLHVEYELIDLEIDEDGTLHLYCGSVTDKHQDRYIVFENVIAGLTLRLLRIADGVSRTARYRGPWYVSAAVTGLQGAQSYSPTLFPAPTFSGVLYSEPSYEVGSEYPLERIQDDPHAILDDLYGQLWRAVGSSFTAANLGT
jgi:hypothetical protein